MVSVLEWVHTTSEKETEVECIAEGKPNPVVTWYRLEGNNDNLKAVEEDNRYLASKNTASSPNIFLTLKS